MKGYHFIIPKGFSLYKNSSIIYQTHVYYKESKLLPKKVLYTFRLVDAKIQCEEALHVFCGCSTYLSPRWAADTEVSFSTGFLEETESQSINSGFNRS